MKKYLIDVFSGLIFGVVFFLVLPPLFYKGEFGAMGYDFFLNFFPQMSDISIGVIYSLVGTVFFVAIRKTSLYMRVDKNQNEKISFLSYFDFFIGFFGSFILFLVFLGFFASRLLS